MKKDNEIVNKLIQDLKTHDYQIFELLKEEKVSEFEIETKVKNRGILIEILKTKIDIVSSTPEYSKTFNTLLKNNDLISSIINKKKNSIQNELKITRKTLLINKSYGVQSEK